VQAVFDSLFDVCVMKEIAPRVTRAAIIRDPTLTSAVAQFAAIQSAATPLGVELSPIDVRNSGDIERAVAAFARAPNGGLIVTSGGSSTRRSLIMTLAARHKLAAVYPFRYFVTSGGLISYGPDPIGREAGRPAGTGAHEV
jgi:putative ABC transport system substrate-binding protein